MGFAADLNHADAVEQWRPVGQWPSVASLPLVQNGRSIGTMTVGRPVPRAGEASDGSDFVDVKVTFSITWIVNAGSSDFSLTDRKRRECPGGLERTVIRRTSDGETGEESC